jgi:L-ascorbate metabolism protein UlaG (beta-lactamase superfamily)
MHATLLKNYSFCLAFLAVSCVPRRLAKGPGDPEVGVQVTWHGHSAFTVEDSVGRQFLVDPFDETVGYKVTWNHPDAVLVTDDHFDHNAVPRSGGYELVNSTGVHTVAGIEVSGYAADHDGQGGRLHGTTRLYVWEMGGVKFAHLGGLGQTALRPEQEAALKGVDVLFVPVGGHVTLDGPMAAALVKALHPRVAVPMNYGTEKVRFFEFDDVDPFTDLFSSVVELPDAKFQVRRAALPEEMTIYLPAMPE